MKLTKRLFFSSRAPWKQRMTWPRTRGTWRKNPFHRSPLGGKESEKKSFSDQILWIIEIGWKIHRFLKYATILCTLKGHTQNCTCRKSVKIVICGSKHNTDWFLKMHGNLVNIKNSKLHKILHYCSGTIKIISTLAVVFSI